MDIRTLGAWEDFGIKGWGSNGTDAIFRGPKNDVHAANTDAITQNYYKVKKLMHADLKFVNTSIGSELRASLDFIAHALALLLNARTEAVPRAPSRAPIPDQAKDYRAAPKGGGLEEGIFHNPRNRK
ncbi:hypothetical protein Naga_101035g2 [Nannochloropsis gaditana]|uniref:Uncharacterized protein n=1 Tax=Nannochloropsis gaditana TaxID=72520 RepID=W7SZA1_9STRA|nr:hypothetical protein Naga_101035g2 [Nannochloropsis gaditana]